MGAPRKRQGDDVAVTLDARVRALFMRELVSFEGPVRVAVRLDGAAPDRSVFAVAWLDGCDTVVVCRAYEKDLDHDPVHALRLVYMARKDLELLDEVVP